MYDTGPGAVRPRLSLTVKTLVDGRLLSVARKERDLVRKADALAEVDPEHSS